MVALLIALLLVHVGIFGLLVRLVSLALTLKAPPIMQHTAISNVVAFPKITNKA